MDIHLINRRLRLDSTLLVQQIHYTVLHELASANHQKQQFNQRACVFFAVSSILAVTLLIALITVIHSKAAACLVLCGLGFLFMSIFYCIDALRVRDGYQRVNEESIFSEEVLKIAENASCEETGVAAYQRFMIPQYWRIIQVDREIHKLKATSLQRAQQMFALFTVFAFALTCVVIVSKFS